MFQFFIVEEYILILHHVLKWLEDDPHYAERREPLFLMVEILHFLSPSRLRFSGLY